MILPAEMTETAATTAAEKPTTTLTTTKTTTIITATTKTLIKRKNNNKPNKFTKPFRSYGITFTLMHISVRRPLASTS